MSGRPLLAELDVLARPLGDRDVELRIFEQRIELETDVTIISPGAFPDRKEDLLGVAHELVGELPGDVVIRQALLHELTQR